MTNAPVDQATPLDTFEMRLYIARWHAGRLSAKQAAARVGVSDTTWRNWENGTHVEAAKKPWMLYQIALKLGVSQEWLEKGGPLQTQSAPGPDGPEGEGGAAYASGDSNSEPAGLKDDRSWPTLELVA